MVNMITLLLLIKVNEINKVNKFNRYYYHCIVNMVMAYIMVNKNNLTNKNKVIIIVNNVDNVQYTQHVKLSTWLSNIAVMVNKTYMFFMVNMV